MKNLIDSLEHRRSYYQIEAKSPIPDAKIQQLLETAMLHCPTPFNMQQTRAVLLLGEEHKKLWDIALASLRRVTHSDADFDKTSNKVNTSFKAGYGTILFFNETAILNQYAIDYPLFEDKFFSWGDQSNGMLQHSVWMLLEDEGFGASLQHYNPLIDEEVKMTWDLPESWELLSQMPFGLPLAQPGEKSFEDVHKRVLVKQS